MEEIMNSIIVSGPTPEKSVNRELLERYTTRIPSPFLKKVRWNKIEHLYILGNALDAAGVQGEENLLPGAYVDVFRKWALIVGAEDQDIQKYLSRCTDKMEKLVVRFTGTTELSFRGLTGLKSLLLENNSRLRKIWRLEQLCNLRKLHLSRTAVKNIEISEKLRYLSTFSAKHTPLESANFLEKLPGLRVAILTDTRIKKLPPLDGLSRLNVLTLSDSDLSTLEGIEFPPNLATLSLNGTEITRLPDSVGKLRKLKVLDLSDLKLDQMPPWLLDLGLEFTLDDGDGIRLKGTTIENVDMSIFELPREMIEQWLRNRVIRNKKHLNNLLTTYEVKIIGALHSEMPIPVSRPFNESIIGATHSAIPNIVSLPDCLSWGREPPRKKPAMALRDIPGVWVGDDSPSEKSIWNGEWEPRDYYEPYDMYRLDFSRPIARGMLKKHPDKAKTDEEVGKPLNEIKIVFLGDGEAGKSHTIARLLHDGEQTDDFPGVSTPGIVIDDKTYTIDGREIKVHFWDFGGQEILHSMHRMFLTEKTLYVVVLNVREGNQQERARYWLYNLRSFADGAPVLLVLNKMDMNENASVNESDLRAMYPGLTEIVKMSAKDDSKQSFEDNFLAALKRQIGAFRYLESPFLPAWSRLKNELQTMKTSYIRGDAFRALSDKCGVRGSDEVRTGLLEWFSNLGVSFFYSGSAKLEDYVVLRPDWITNAIYIILFNKIKEVKNGLVTHDTIIRMLQSTDTETIQRAVEDAQYKVEEVEFVLNVVRKFRLSFLVEDGTEFLPMLCDANSTPAAEVYSTDPNALEFRMHYEYLPNNVLHRLMVDRRRELDRKNVWLTGARFVYDNTGVSAVVKSEGNLLRIMVRSEKRRQLAQLYLDVLKTELERINQDMGLNVAGMEVAYKTGDVVEYFDYEDLTLAQEIGDPYIRSKALRKRIPIAEVLMQSDHPVDERRGRLIRDLAKACEKLQDNHNYWSFDEDGRTRVIKESLDDKGYNVHEQSRGGISAGGKKAGELDLDIRLEPDVRWTIFEALNLSGSSDSQIEYWNAHLDKLLDNYNAVGCPFLFHVSYVKCSKDKFLGLCQTFRTHLNKYSPEGFEVQPKLTRNVPLAEQEYQQNRFIQAVESVYDCGGAPMTVYHFFVRIGA